MPVYSLETKERIFMRITTWLKESKRLFPDEKPKEGGRVTEMREWMKDPAVVAEIRRVMGKEAKKVTGSPGIKAPTRDKDAERQKAAEGSALHALVFDGEGLEDQP